MRKRPPVSVIIPVYNVERYLDACIRSVVGQTYRDLEIILVDDGSTDASGNICDRWKDEDERIRVLHQPNMGISAARNTGLRICTGSVIAFVDSDDRIKPEMVKKMLDRMETDHSDIVVCAVESVDNSGARVGVSSVTDGVLDTRQALSELIRQRYVKQTVWNKLYKREVIRGIEFEPGKLYEDIFWTYQAIGCASRISLTPDVFYSHYDREGSITHSGYTPNNLDALDGLYQSCEYVRERYPELFDDVLLAYMGCCRNHM